MPVVERFPRPLREIENCWITLADGCRLAARIWLPEDAETDPVPAILEYLPYRKRDGTAVRDALTHPYFAGHGYAAVRVDMRGNGESDGLMWDEYLKQEQDDALEVIDWLAAQPWCSGSVGMIGISWGGFNGLQVAARAPEALKAIVTLCSTDDRYADDIHYKGGCLLNENLGWASTMLAYSSRPPDPALVGERWRDLWLDRLENQPLLVENWLRHQRRDAFWQHGSVCEDYGAIKAAVFAVGGWADAYSNAIPRLLAGLDAPVKALIGPWVHKYPHFAVPEPRIGFLQEALRWWDHWLKGRDSGIMDEPAYRAYMQEAVPPKPFYEERAGRWIAEPSWPSPNSVQRSFALNPGRLDDEAETETPLTICSPQTTGLASGEFCAIWLGADMPTDQRADDAGSLVFDSTPLDERLEILGAPVVELTLSVDRPVAFVALRLCDLAPTGASTRVSYGILNLTHRESHENPKPLVPGERLRVRVQLDDIAYALPPGHRIRLAISTAYWPLIWPSPETVTATVYSGASTLSLPLRPARVETPLSFEPPESAPPLSLEVLRAPTNSRTIETDVKSGETTLQIVDDFGEHRNPTHGLITSSTARETLSIRSDDPLSALAHKHWTQILRRDDWQVRVESRTTFWSDREAFHIKAEVLAYEGEHELHRKTWDRKVPRDLI